MLYAVFCVPRYCGGQRHRKMQEVWNAIKDGANAYLQKQMRSILPLIAILTVVLFFFSVSFRQLLRPWKD
ncbi:sodium/proton-translocating pyrophosphatase [Candidatus Villigracilis saccharophilus]|uniref:sodium/proton-translocating pyrophosphatase n=1 Tax=Candidatus Villigracilis saccharophilus TaxID=3140684 RepID=UPI0031E7B760